jgi:hypothetical protein
LTSAGRNTHSALNLSIATPRSTSDASAHSTLSRSIATQRVEIMVKHIADAHSRRLIQFALSFLCALAVGFCILAPAVRPLNEAVD